MKKLTTLLVALFLGIGISHATEAKYHNGYFNDSRIIFMEGGVEFALFPDGQFDFNFLGPNINGFYNGRGNNWSFNSGFYYDPYIQYDLYGAIIQIENVPLFYDPYGRLIQAGDVFINYRGGFVNRVGNLRVFYQNPGFIAYTRGFINPFNRRYVFRPWHRFYRVPVHNVVVFHRPYRLNYCPIRFDYGYHRLHWNSPRYYNAPARFRNGRFYRPGAQVRYRDFERGRRNNRGIAVARRNQRSILSNIAEGRQTVRYRPNVRSSEQRQINRRSRSSSIANRETRARNTARSGNRTTVNRSRTRSNALAANNDRNVMRSERSTSRTVERQRNPEVRNQHTVRNNRSTVQRNRTRSNRSVNSRSTRGRDNAMSTSRSSRNARATPSRSVKRSTGRSASNRGSSRVKRSGR